VLKKKRVLLQYKIKPVDFSKQLLKGTKKNLLLFLLRVVLGSNCEWFQYSPNLKKVQDQHMLVEGGALLP
jgi:hypothetical protein